MPTLPDHPDQIVFSGGGLRCFWQGGFLTRLTDDMTLAPARVTGVSGGALAGAAWLSGTERSLLEEMCTAFEAQEGNLDLFDPDEDGITPHQELYCSVVGAVIDDAAARKVAEGPQYQVLIAHTPQTGAPAAAGAAFAAAYEAELHIVGSPHFSWAEKLGLTAELVDASKAAREGRLVDLVSAAAVIPPVFKPPLWNGQPVVDGGMTDQAPMPEPDEGTTLVLLTRHYDKLPKVEGRHYVWPSEETPADKIDFSDPGKLRRTWALGERDAEKYLNA